MTTRNAGGRPLSARGHRDDTVLDLHDIECGLRQMAQWHAQQIKQCRYLHSHVVSALTHMAEAQVIDDGRVVA